MTQQFFKLHSNAKVCRVLQVETNTVGGQGFDAFVQIEEPDYLGVAGYTQTKWVAVCRGEFVESADQQTSDTKRQTGENTMHKRTVSEVAARFGCTAEQVRKQYRANIQGLTAMLAKAEASKTGKHRGYTAEELKTAIANYEAVLQTA